MNKDEKKYTLVSIYHYWRLGYRSALFLAALIVYIVMKIKHNGNFLQYFESMPIMINIIWVVFVVEMIMRFFPSKLESPGSQKQFAENYIKSGNTDIVVHDNNATLLVALIWVSFNGVFGALHMLGFFDDGIMILLCLAYSVCDMICILFFCPFQSWFLKNKCCCTCRIYNWDYAMMFTPLFFVKNVHSWTLLAMAVALMFRWEINFYRHPERFSDKTNEYLRCKNCSEKLCVHKKQLEGLWKKIAEYTAEKTKKLKK